MDRHLNRWKKIGRLLIKKDQAKRNRKEEKVYQL